MDGVDAVDAVVGVDGVDGLDGLDGLEVRGGFPFLPKPGHTNNQPQTAFRLKRVPGTHNPRDSTKQGYPSCLNILTHRLKEILGGYCLGQVPLEMPGFYETWVKGRGPGKNLWEGFSRGFGPKRDSS